MRDLNTIIRTLSNEEQHKFMAYLEKKNKRKDAKNIELFKLLNSGESSSEVLSKKLYGNNNKTAYHALRQRLFESLIDFIANRSLAEENSMDMQVIKYILAARTFFLHKHPKIGYNILNKAESIATERHMFSMLNEIYHTQIQYAYNWPNIDLEKTIKKFKINQKNLYLEDQLNIVYAQMRTTLNNITQKGHIIDFKHLVNSTLEQHNISLNDSLSFKSLYQLMSLINLSAFVSNNYLDTETFLLDSYQILTRHKTKSNQPFYHIEVTYMIANTLFRNKKFQISTRYLEDMHNIMLEHKNKYYNAFKLKHDLLLALNLNYSEQPDQAILLLEKTITIKHPDLESLLDVYLTLTMCYFQQNELKKAQHLFSKFYHTDQWYTEKAGKEWTIKKNLMEILIHIELHHIDLAESRILSFKRKYSSYLNKIKQSRVLTYLSFVEQYYKNPEQVTTKKFQESVEQSFEWIGANKEDIFVMSYYAWLKSKMENTPLYTTTLHLIAQAQNVNN